MGVILSHLTTILFIIYTFFPFPLNTQSSLFPSHTSIFFFSSRSLFLFSFHPSSLPVSFSLHFLVLILPPHSTHLLLLPSFLPSFHQKKISHQSLHTPLPRLSSLSLSPSSSFPHSFLLSTDKISPIPFYASGNLSQEGWNPRVVRIRPSQIRLPSGPTQLTRKGRWKQRGKEEKSMERRR